MSLLKEFPPNKKTYLHPHIKREITGGLRHRNKDFCVKCCTVCGEVLFNELRVIQPSFHWWHTHRDSTAPHWQRAFVASLSLAAEPLNAAQGEAPRLFLRVSASVSAPNISCLHARSRGVLTKLCSDRRTHRSRSFLSLSISQKYEVYVGWP